MNEVNHPQQPARPTFGDLYVLHNFPVPWLSIQTGVPIEVIDRMLVGESVSKGHAMKVLRALSIRTRERYTLQTVAVKLIEEGENGVKKEQS